MIKLKREQFYPHQPTKDWIAIDGKKLKNTLTNYSNEHQNILVMVSWFSQETNLVIKAESFESKRSSENAKVKSMIENCAPVNQVFTLDALHCSKDTTKAIIDSHNDYLITVKANQIKLLGGYFASLLQEVYYFLIMNYTVGKLI